MQLVGVFSPASVLFLSPNTVRGTIYIVADHRRLLNSISRQLPTVLWISACTAHWSILPRHLHILYKLRFNNNKLILTYSNLSSIRVTYTKGPQERYPFN